MEWRPIFCGAEERPSYLIERARIYWKWRKCTERTSITTTHMVLISWSSFKHCQWICLTSFNLFSFQFALLDKLLEMSSLLSRVTDRRSGETRFTNNGGRSLLYCNTNIMRYTSRRILKAINSTSFDQEHEVCDHAFEIKFLYDQASALHKHAS